MPSIGHIIGHALLLVIACLLVWSVQRKRYQFALTTLVKLCEFRGERVREINADYNALVADLMYAEGRLAKAEHERDTLREEFMQAAPTTYEKLHPIIVPRLTADMVLTTATTENPE